jgi:hypothetical protein
VAFWFVAATKMLPMKLSMRRIILFTGDMPKMMSFYRDVLGLAVLKDERGWKVFDAGGCMIALHNGTSRVGRRPPKIGFWADDVSAARQALVARGAKLGKVMSGGGLTRCEAIHFLFQAEPEDRLGGQQPWSSSTTVGCKTCIKQRPTPCSRVQGCLVSAHCQTRQCHGTGDMRSIKSSH